MLTVQRKPFHAKVESLNQAYKFKPKLASMTVKPRRACSIEQYLLFNLF